MKYVVTGASGFAGRHLIRHLVESGDQVTALARSPETIDFSKTVGETTCDLENRQSTTSMIKEACPEGIFHLAAAQTSVGKSWDDPERTIQANLRTTLNVLAAARACPRPPRVLVVSSAEVVGDVPKKKQPIDESVPPDPRSPYAASKALCETTARFYTRDLGVPCLVARAFNHIGPGQAESFVIPEFAARIAEIERRGSGTLEVGNLGAERDFLDVRDVAAAYRTIMRKGTPGETYNVGSGTARSIRSLLDDLLKLSPATIEVVVDKGRFRPADIARLQSDSAKLQKLGWRPSYELTDTLHIILKEARNRHGKD